MTECDKNQGNGSTKAVKQFVTFACRVRKDLNEEVSYGRTSRPRTGRKALINSLFHAGIHSANTKCFYLVARKHLCIFFWKAARCKAESTPGPGTGLLTGGGGQGVGGDAK